MQNNSQFLSKVAIAVRSALATSSGNEDKPFDTVILQFTPKCSKGKHCCINVDTDIENLSVEQIREVLNKAIADYVVKYSNRPDAVCLKNIGTFSIVQQAASESAPLKNKIAIITGAAGAIGYGICKGLLESGCHVAVTDLPGERLDSFAAELKKTWPYNVIAVPMDVTSSESVTKGFESAAIAWGGVDIVVVNAGIAHVSSLVDMSLEQFQKLEKVNIEGALLTIAEAGRQFKMQNTGGDIVVISTKNVFAPGAKFGAYSATKAACHQLARIASLEFAEFGVRVNMVSPDAVFSEGEYKSGLWATVGPDRMKARGLDEKGLEEYYRSRNLLKARVTGKHVANAVLFFVTRQTPTTGATIPVDGGLPDSTPR
jgi:NAD(P)-dependent dehydrogenase (short-subunit alcohol dehydrogenase family)